MRRRIARRANPSRRNRSAPHSGVPVRPHRGGSPGSQNAPAAVCGAARGQQKAPDCGRAAYAQIANLRAAAADCAAVIRIV